ncbi:hypothetical protein K432DRAFT_411112 [Lepidopterella palustris CBS 459.81]|uniref:Uncharacterized protein n=1 Tax=Lepidopterella palustris CBS 459.81 TaxID=1314670 RepID=A0A8E2DWU8_9PEZI|nr:hypothetical protein K432DRAFT_411112 [Lepidopterella palustris CBS 459.81]
MIQIRDGLDAQMKTRPLPPKGHQQLFCRVRALLCKSRIPVLNEATSNVDSETDVPTQYINREELVQHTIVTAGWASTKHPSLARIWRQCCMSGQPVQFGPLAELVKKPSMLRDLHNG